MDAIRSTEEERQLLSANRVNPLDDELIKTKEKLKSPSIRIEREEQARLAKVKQGKGDDVTKRLRTQSENSIQNGRHDSICSELDSEESGNDVSFTESSVQDTKPEGRPSDCSSDYSSEAVGDPDEKLSLLQSVSQPVTETDSETSQKFAGDTEIEAEISGISVVQSFKEMSPSSHQKVRSKSDSDTSSTDLKLKIPKGSHADKESVLKASLKADQKLESTAKKDSVDDDLPNVSSVQTNICGKVFGDSCDLESCSQASLDLQELDEIVLHNSDLQENLPEGASSDKTDTVTSTTKDYCICKDGGKRDTKKPNEKRNKITLNQALESDKLNQNETKELLHNSGIGGSSVLSKSVTDVCSFSGSFERLTDVNSREMTPTSQQFSGKSSSAVHKRKHKMKELRKCNSLGRGKDEKCESKPPTGRKFSFDLSGVSPTDLNLRSLLHDAIIARGEQQNAQKNDSS